MPEEALSLHDVCKTIDDFSIMLDFSINHGELVSIVGPSGCGKSTTIGLISGLITPYKGRIIIDSRDVTSEDPDKRSAAVVFQDYALFPNMDTGRNIAFPMKIRHVQKSERQKRVDELLDTVRLPSFGKRRINELSGGEKQRIAIARALAANPSILLLDEPLSALDAKLRKILRREICRIQKEFGQTTIYVTHDQSEALSMSDRIIVLNNGRIEQFDTPQKIFQRPATLFTAQFMGEGTALDGSLAESALRLSSVDFSQNRFSDTVETSTLFFRPEDVQIAESFSLCSTLQFDHCHLESADYEGSSWALEYSYKGSTILAASKSKPESSEASLSIRTDRILEYKDGILV